MLWQRVIHKPSLDQCTKIYDFVLIKSLLEDMQILNSLPIKVYCDNKIVISIDYNSVLHDRIKHIEVDK